MKIVLNPGLWLVVMLISFGALQACKESTRTGGESETNWLKRCRSQDDCSGDNSCICGICTRRCESADDCSEIPGAASCLVTEPLDNGACRVVAAAGNNRGVCVAGCLSDSDCDDDSGFECIMGVCVAILHDPSTNDSSRETDYGMVFPEIDSAITNSENASAPEGAESFSVDADTKPTGSDATVGADATVGTDATEGDENVVQNIPLGPVSHDVFPRCPCTVDAQVGTRAPKYGEYPENPYGGPELLERVMTLEGGGCGINGFQFFGDSSPLTPESTDPALLKGLEELCLYYVSCAIACNSDADCPDVDSGSAVARCSDSKNCYLQCDNQRSCPDGMMCVTGTDGSICLWPQDVTRRGCPAFCEQDPVPRECPNFCALQLMACSPEHALNCCEGLSCSSEGYCVQE